MVVAVDPALPAKHPPPPPPDPPTPPPPFRTDFAVIAVDYQSWAEAELASQQANQAQEDAASALDGATPRNFLVMPQAAGGNKPLPPHWFPLNSALVSRMPTGYIVENAVLRGGT